MIFCLFVVATHLAFATEDEPAIEVMPMDSDFPVEDLRRIKGINIRDGSEYSQDKGKNATIEAKIRDEIFAKTGIAAIVVKFDQLERDFLVLRAREYPLKKLAEAYPKISQRQLQNLQRLILQHDRK